MRMIIFAAAALAVAAMAQERPVHVLVAYYSQTGNTEKLAMAIGKGAAGVKGVEVAVKKTVDVKDAEILAADGEDAGAVTRTVESADVRQAGSLRPADSRPVDHASTPDFVRAAAGSRRAGCQPAVHRRVTERLRPRRSCARVPRRSESW